MDGPMQTITEGMMVPEGSGLEWLVSEAPQPPPEPQPRGVGLLPSLVQPGPSGEATIARMQRAYSTGDLSMLAHQQTTSVHRLGGLVDSPLFEEALAAIPVPEGAPLRNDGAIAMGRGGGADGGAQTAQQPEMGGMLGAGFGLGVAGASGVRSLGGAVPSSSGSSELLGWAQSLNFDDDYARMGQALAGGALTMPSAPLQPTSRGALGGSLMRKSMSTGDLASWGRTAAEGHPSSSLGPRRIGAYTIEERQERIKKYRDKRHRRNFEKKIKYVCRKTLADSRPRVRGRFARHDVPLKQQEDEAGVTQEVKST